ncbi:MAG TPA: HypC/HybG/HupF family hydrogenase formation chaperone [Acidimicrobiales bacterium]
MSADVANAVVDVGGSYRSVSLAVLVLEDRAPEPGEWVLIHTGLAVEIIGEAAAAVLTDMLDDMHEGVPRS